MTKIVLMIILIVGVVVGITMLQKQQTVTTRASSNVVNDAFEFRDANGKVLTCTTDANNVLTCPTETLDVSVTIKDPNAIFAQ